MRGRLIDNHYDRNPRVVFCRSLSMGSVHIAAINWANKVRGESRIFAGSAVWTRLPTIRYLAANTFDLSPLRRNVTDINQDPYE